MHFLAFFLNLLFHLLLSNLFLQVIQELLSVDPWSIVLSNVEDTRILAHFLLQSLLLGISQIVDLGLRMMSDHIRVYAILTLQVISFLLHINNFEMEISLIFCFLKLGIKDMMGMVQFSFPIWLRKLLLIIYKMMFMWLVIQVISFSLIQVLFYFKSLNVILNLMSMQIEFLVLKINVLRKHFLILFLLIITSL